MGKPKKWTEVYPQGTKEGDEECKFFISLARNRKYEWRSTGAIVKESGLTKKRVEEIIAKYLKVGIVVTNSSMEDHWGYWERVPTKFLKKDEGNISKKDQKKRVNKHIQGQDITDNADAVEEDDDDTVSSKVQLEPWSYGCGMKRGNIPDVKEVFDFDSKDEYRGDKKWTSTCQNWVFDDTKEDKDQPLWEDALKAFDFMTGLEMDDNIKIDAKVKPVYSENLEAITVANLRRFYLTKVVGRV